MKKTEQAKEATMEKVFEKLRTLQGILSQRFEIEKEIDEIPKILSTKTELLNRLKKTYVERNAEYDATQAKIKDVRERMTVAEQERQKFEQQMDVIKTQREYEALDKEIKDANEREQNLRKDLQAQTKRLEEMKVSLDREAQMIDKQEEEVKGEQSRLKHEIKEREKELGKLQKEEAKITPGLDGEILFKFERIIRSKSGVGIVPIIKGVCTGCHMILAGQFVNDVRRGDRIQFCPHCSRILYYEDQGGPEDMMVFETGAFAAEEEEAEEE
jgi:predicted  nucleic acid-binding Zn-ribbon protein